MHALITFGQILFAVPGETGEGTAFIGRLR